MTALRTWWKKIGCVSRALLPHRTIRSVSSTSRYELVPPPAPNTVARPATLGACQVRLQLSMLLLPRTARLNFWAAKLTSLVALLQLKVPKVVGPWAAFAACEPGDDPVERLVPGRGAKLAVLRVAHEGLGQSNVGFRHGVASCGCRLPQCSRRGGSRRLGLRSGATPGFIGRFDMTDAPMLDAGSVQRRPRPRPGGPRRQPPAGHRWSAGRVPARPARP